MTTTTRATPAEIRDYFGPGTDGKLVTLQELKALKEAPDGTKREDYSQIADGIGDGTLTY